MESTAAPATATAAAPVPADGAAPVAAPALPSKTPVTLEIWLKMVFIVVGAVERQLERSKSHRIDWDEVSRTCGHESDLDSFEPHVCRYVWRYAAYGDQPKTVDPKTLQYDSDEEDFLLHPKQYSDLYNNSSNREGRAPVVERAVQKAHRVWLRGGSVDCDREVSLAMLTARTEPFRDLLQGGEAKEKTLRAAKKKKRGLY